MNLRFTILSLVILLFVSKITSQEKLPTNENSSCSFESTMQEFYKNNPEEFEKAKNFEKKVGDYLKAKSTTNLKATTNYIIPVVFHIYGNEWQGRTVDDATLKQALNAINENFAGFNDAVDPYFASIEGGMNIEFKLAQIDPNGNTTTGIIYHETKEGFGLSGTNDGEIAKYAWDNYKYFNVHIQLIIKSGGTNNSGIAWFPATNMSDKGTARVVYNGKYIIYSPPASSLTHEFGHFLGLHHTFNGGCVSSGGDLVDDTPPCTSGQGCDYGTKNCFGQNINTENHMDYNPCEKMFTKGQVARMEAHMVHDARKTLWEDANLIATGVKNALGARVVFNYQQPGDSEYDKYLTLLEGAANDGSITNKRKIKAVDGAQFAISSGYFTQGTHFSVSGVPSGLTTRIKVIDSYTAEISFDGKANQHTNANSAEITITLLNAAISGGVSQLYSTSGKYKIEFLDPYGTFYEVLSPHIWMGYSENNTGSFKTSFNSPAVGNALMLNLMNYDGNIIAVDNYNNTFEVLCNSGSNNVKLLSDNATVNASGTWAPKPQVATSPPVLSSPSYTSWRGQTGYIGIRIPTQLGGYIYGWLKTKVTSDGTTGIIMAYGVNEQPDGSMTTNVDKPMVLYEDDRFLESVNNNGTIQNTLKVKLYNTSFATTGTLTQGTHYTIANVPSGLQFSVNVTSSTTAELIMSGAASSHDWDYFDNINLSFLDAAFASHSASQVIQSSYSIYLEYIGVSKMKTLTDAKMDRNLSDPGKAWFYPLSSHESIGYTLDYQLQIYDNGEAPGVKFISWRKDAVANDAFELTPLDENVVVGPNSSWKRGREYNSGTGQHMIDSDTYQAWRGKTKYVGIRARRSGRLHYGWAKLRVSSDGKVFEFLECAINGKPETGIITGTINSDGGGGNDTQAPTTPTNLKITSTTSNSITLSWDASSDNIGVASYTVNKTDGNVNYTTTSTSYTVTGLTANKTYTFYVLAKDAAGNSSGWSNAATGATSSGGGDTQAPTAPSNLSAGSITSSGVTLSWTASTDNVGVTGYDIFRGSTNIGTTTGTSYNVTGLTANTTYSFTVKAKDAAGNISPASNSVSVTTQGGTSSYCTTSHSSPLNYFYISNVSFAGINNTSTLGNNSSAYSDYTSTSASVEKGQSYNLSVSFTPGWSGNSGAAWIDWNGDGDFDDAGEKVLDITSASSPYSSAVNIPTSAVSGNTRMRVRITYNGSITPCGTLAYGETEDYTINIGGGSADTQAPTAPTNLSASNITGTSVTLSWSASTDNVGVTSYEVYRSTLLVGTTSGTSLNVTGLNEGYTYYFSVKAKDAAGNTSASSSSLTVKTTDGGSTVSYCSASCTSGPEHISNVSFGSINNASARDNYHDYTNISTTVSKGNNYTLTVTIGSVYSGDKATAWIDWNGDGDFADSGEKYSLTVSGSTAMGNINVPASASVSTTRMRIRVFYYSASDDPCGDKQYGEVEDYTINISSSASGNSYLAENIELGYSDIKVFPNPSDGMFKLKVKNNYEGKLNVKILNMSGKVITQKYIDKVNEEVEIQMNIDKPGTYLIQMVSGVEMVSNTIIIK